MLRKRFAIATVIAAIGWFAVSATLVALGERYLNDYKFHGGGDTALDRGTMFVNAGQGIFLPVRWVAAAGAPDWLLLVMAGVSCLAVGAATVGIAACLTSRWSGP